MSREISAQTHLLSMFSPNSFVAGSQLSSEPRGATITSTRPNLIFPPLQQVSDRRRSTHPGWPLTPRWQRTPLPTAWRWARRRRRTRWRLLLGECLLPSLPSHLRIGRGGLALINRTSDHAALITSPSKISRKSHLLPSFLPSFPRSVLGCN